MYGRQEHPEHVFFVRGPFADISIHTVPNLFIRKLHIYLHIIKYIIHYTYLVLLYSR